MQRTRGQRTAIAKSPSVRVSLVGGQRGKTVRRQCWYMGSKKACACSGADLGGGNGPGFVDELRACRDRTIAGGAADNGVGWNGEAGAPAEGVCCAAMTGWSSCSDRYYRRQARSGRVGSENAHYLKVFLWHSDTQAGRMPAGGGGAPLRSRRGRSPSKQTIARDTAIG